MSDHGVQPLPAARPAKTTLRRFGAAIALAAVASVSLPFLITPILIMATGVRLQGMAIGVPLGLMVGWSIFPFVAWKPFRPLQLLALPIVAVAALAGLTILPEHWLTSPDGDRYGIFGAMINFAVCVLAVYGGLTWSRNVLLRADTDSPPEALSLLNRMAVAFVRGVRPRLGRLWRNPWRRRRPDGDAT